MLTQEILKELLHYDSETGIFIWKDRPIYSIEKFHSSTWNTRYAGKKAGVLTKDGRIRITINYKRYLAHRLAWLYIYGSFPKNQIDHKDGNPLNNKINNLREANHSENSQNQRKALSNNKSTGLLGTFLDKRDGRIYARIMINKKFIHLGCFKTKEEAHQAYLIAKRNIHPFGML